MTFYKKKEVIHCGTSDDWRNWLSIHYDQKEGVWLVLYKKNSSSHNMSYENARNTALCYGWIDSKPNKRDDQSWYQYFAKRNPKSNWSKVNKQVITELIKSKRMAAPGLAMVNLAKTSGTWDALKDVDNLIVPKDLKAKFDENAIAWEHWKAFPSSAKRNILEWIFNAKRSETRLKRIYKTVRLAENNIRANQ